MPPLPAAAASPDEKPAPASELVVSLLKRGKQLLADGDVAGARLVYARAAEEGSGAAALAVGATYDPLFHSEHAVIGIRPDVDQAAKWYERAAALGDSQAQRRLAKLRDVASVASHG